MAWALGHGEVWLSASLGLSCSDPRAEGHTSLSHTFESVHLLSVPSDCTSFSYSMFVIKRTQVRVFKTK